MNTLQAINSISVSSFRLIVKLLALLVLTFNFITPPANANPLGGQIPKIPAFLPMANTVPQTQATPIDGEWMVTSIGKRIRIQGGRAYAVDPWVHLFVLQISPMMVVIKDIIRTGPGQYSGQDLPLMGAWKAQLSPDGSLNVNVAGALGPVNYSLMPITQDDPQAFAAEKSGDYSSDDNNYDESDEEDGQYEDEAIEEDDDYSEDEDDYGSEEDNRPEELEATKHKLYSCKGKGIYYSKVGGVKACYTCPKGMKRTSPTRKMNHPKACVNRKGINTYAKGKKLGNLAKCRKGQFKHKGRCKSCPEGYTPIFNYEVSLGIKFYTGSCRLTESE